MKALTLTQPWATLMALQQKTIETRSWNTNFRGEVIIHAAKGFPKWAQGQCVFTEFQKALGGLTAAELPRSVGLCVVEVIGCVRTDEMHKAEFILGYKPNVRELNFGDYSAGRYAWLTKFVRLIDDPEPRKGALGLREWDPDAAAYDALMRGDAHL